jgi:hypothetical protein
MNGALAVGGTEGATTTNAPAIVGRSVGSPASPAPVPDIVGTVPDVGAAEPWPVIFAVVCCTDVLLESAGVAEGVDVSELESVPVDCAAVESCPPSWGRVGRADEVAAEAAVTRNAPSDSSETGESFMM